MEDELFSDDERIKVVGLLAARFPWLTTTEEIQVSGADTIDRLTELYEELGGICSDPPVDEEDEE